ncbi:MAG: amidase family protein [Gammaproteobacteria bacterium]|nr:amidase family protein [Gammaproteobacteria bacterium]
MTTIRTRDFVTSATLAIAALSVLGSSGLQAQESEFRLEEATIADVHRAIQAGELTCLGLVESYLDRARVYNGVTNQLVTRDGEPVEAVPGTVRAGAPLQFPTQTVAITEFLPNFEDYEGPPIEFGRMEPTASDPTVYQQFGMTVGMPDAGQTNALGTLNLRGERSVTCKGEADRHPSAGALPEGAHPACEVLRQYPDALEQAMGLDIQYGSEPDLERHPMYCIPFSFKDPFDTKDMRTTAAADAQYDIDFPANDHTLVAQLRDKGAIIYAKAVNTEYNGRGCGGSGCDPGGPHEAAAVLPSTLGYQRSTWSGNPSSVYDTTRAASLGSSSGSAVGVSANLVMCSLCEETSMSCRGPANHNSVALLLPHKSVISFHGNAIGSDIYYDRSGIHCRSIVDTAKVLDALKDPDAGFYDPRDIWTTVPRATVLDSYAEHTVDDAQAGALSGVRIGVIRESMLKFPGVRADEPIVDAAVREIEEVLRDQLGATLVESIDPFWPDDANIENMQPSYTDALAELVPIFFPEILYWLDDDDQPVFPDFAAMIQPTEFAPGIVHGSSTMAPVDYMVAMAEGTEPPPSNLNLRTIMTLGFSNAMRFHVSQYLVRRAADWAERGYTETLDDWAALSERSKYWADAQRAWFSNWAEVDDIRREHGARQGIDERIKLRELLRRLEVKVMQENDLDVLVRLHYPLPPGKIGLSPQPEPEGTVRGEIRMGPYAGLTSVLIPAGYVRTVYDPVFTLSDDRERYVPTNNNTPATVPEPGMPFSLVFRGDPGSEGMILRVASAYESASRRRVPPPAFPALEGEL